MKANKITPSARRGRSPDNVENMLVCRLALERCQQKLAHLHAILHLCLPREDEEEDGVAVDSMRQILSSMAQELSYSVDTLAVAD